MTRHASNHAETYRQAQISELKDELQGLLADQQTPRTIDDIRNGRGGERLTPDQERVAIALFDPIEVDEFAHDKDPLAPTPGDPKAITRLSDGRTYDQDVKDFLRTRSDTVLRHSLADPTSMGPGVLKLMGDVPNGTSVDDFETKMLLNRRMNLCLQEIVNEIDTGFHYHYEKNGQSIERLQAEYIRDPSQFSADEAPQIYGVRSGSATDEDRVGLLVRHPQMQSIEGVEYTGPLDIKGTNAVLNEMGRRLRAMQFTGAFDRVTIFETDEQAVSMKNVTKILEQGPNGSDDPDGFGLTVSKMVLAEVEHNGVTVELVLKRRSERMPTTPQLRGVSNNILVTQYGTKVDFQPIALSAYWRVKKQETAKLYVPPGGSRVAIQAARSLPASDTDDFSDLIVNIGDGSH